MTLESRWIDELPLESAERELLVAGKAARPSRDDVDANWRAFSIALSGPTSAAASAGASHAMSAKAASGLATKASAAGLLSAATVKSFAVGIALGVGVSAASAVVERVRPPQVRPASAASRPLAPGADPTPRVPKPVPRTGALPISPPLASAFEQGGRAEPALRAAPHTTTAAAAIPAPTSALPLAGAPSATLLSGPSLSAQAHELAQVKRLLDAGATAEALRHLTATFSAGEPSALSEERDALFVQALTRAGRGAEARARAREFLGRYSRSPYLESIRRVAEE
ncbi:MAG TPA: hypothetical protein VLJ38_09150 [Polyangiaceae bacterium]|nr:hypothetical protein [Polyangiaceae bacterium]